MRGLGDVPSAAAAPQSASLVHGDVVGCVALDRVLRIVLWSKDEFDAVGVSMAGRGPRADEFIAALKAIWTTDPVELRGRYYAIPRSLIGPKPVQKPHPAICLAARVPPALKRAATLADGWNPVGLSLDVLARMSESLRTMARAAGRAAERLEIVVRANVRLIDEPLGDSRAPFTGAFDEIRRDVEAARQLRVTELFFDATFSVEVEPRVFLHAMEQLRAAASTFEHIDHRAAAGGTAAAGRRGIRCTLGPRWRGNRPAGVEPPSVAHDVRRAVGLGDRYAC